VLSSGRKLRDKGVAIGKREIEDIPIVEAVPRYTALEAPDPANDEVEVAE
jgi:DNA recombination protein RmuC